MTGPGTVPLRILLVTEASGGGVGRHVLDLAAGLEQRGHEVVLVYSPRRADPTFLRRLADWPELEREPLPMARTPHPSDLLARRRLVEIVRRRGPFDVIHAQSTKAGLVARPAHRLARTVVYTPHCIYSMNPAAGWAGRVMVAWERQRERHTDAIIAVSPDESEHLLQRGFDVRRIHLIPNGIGPAAGADYHECRRQLGWHPAWPIAGFVGRLSAQKNPELLVEAFARLTRELPDARLAIIGTGPREASLRAQALRRGLDDRLLWMGHRESHDVMPALDLLTLPSRYESFPYVLLEALTAGLPIVATPVGGVAQTVDHGKNGLIVHPDAPEELAAACQQILGQPELRRAFGSWSRQKSLQYDLDTMVERTVAVYRSRSTRRFPHPTVLQGTAA